MVSRVLFHEFEHSSKRGEIDGPIYREARPYIIFLKRKILMEESCNTIYWNGIIFLIYIYIYIYILILFFNIKFIKKWDLYFFFSIFFLYVLF
jgi:hypothetical protein